MRRTEGFRPKKQTFTLLRGLWVVRMRKRGFKLVKNGIAQVSAIEHVQR